MAQSERSKHAMAAAGWINYQKMFLGVAPEDVSTIPPQQFKDIFMVGFALGEARARKDAKDQNDGS